MATHKNMFSWSKYATSVQIGKNKVRASPDDETSFLFYFWRILDGNLEVLYLSKTGVSRILQKRNRGLQKSDSILSSSAMSSDLHESRVDHSVVERATGMCNLSGKTRIELLFSPRTEWYIYRTINRWSSRSTL